MIQKNIRKNPMSNTFQYIQIIDHNSTWYKIFNFTLKEWCWCRWSSCWSRRRRATWWTSSPGRSPWTRTSWREGSFPAYTGPPPPSSWPTSTSASQPPGCSLASKCLIPGKRLKIWTDWTEWTLKARLWYVGSGTSVCVLKTSLKLTFNRLLKGHPNLSVQNMAWA